MKKVFSFTEPKADPKAKPEPKEFEINGQSFILKDDLEGLELLRFVGDSAVAAGVHRLFSRVIEDDDWPRFVEVNRKCKLADFGRMGTAIIDLYAGNPTTEADAS